MPITITIEATDANEARQLVQDLAGTMTGLKPEDVPVDTKVTTLQQGVQAHPAAPAAQAPAAPAAPITPPVSPAVPTAQTPAVAPMAPPIGAPTAAPAAPTVPASPPAAPAAPVAPAAAPTSAPTYDFNQIATATMQLQQAGQNIMELFAQFDIQALNQLPKERYGEYAALLRQRGAKI